MTRDIPKGWKCPACAAPIRFWEDGHILGWEVKDAGRWYVKGTCRACGARVMFTKQGGVVLRGEGKSGDVPFTTVIRKRGTT